MNYAIERRANGAPRWTDAGLSDGSGLVLPLVGGGDSWDFLRVVRTNRGVWLVIVHDEVVDAKPSAFAATLSANEWI